MVVLKTSTVCYIWHSVSRTDLGLWYTSHTSSYIYITKVIIWLLVLVQYIISSPFRGYFLESQFMSCILALNVDHIYEKTESLFCYSLNHICSPSMSCVGVDLYFSIHQINKKTSTHEHALWPVYKHWIISIDHM